MMFSPRKALYFVCVFVAVSLCRSDDRNYPRGETYERPLSCKRYECPPYTALHSQSEFEIRSYETALWVSAPNIPSKSYKTAARKGFLTLFSYYKGNNTENVKINMTTPVLIDAQNSAYTVYFYVPKKYQSDGDTPLPQPLTSAITQVKLPKHKYAAVRRFGSFITDDIIPTQVDALKKSLKGSPYDRASALDEYTVAGYDAPFRTTDRMYEVMIFFD